MNFNPYENAIAPSAPQMYGGWANAPYFYPFQQTSETMHRQRPNRDVAFEPQQAASVEHGSGFKLYNWNFMMNPNELLVCRLIGENTERVISAGFATEYRNPSYVGQIPRVEVHQNFPRNPNVWITTLKSSASDVLSLNLYLIVRS